MGNVVWAYGCVRCGEVNDLSLSRMQYVHMLDPGGKTIADSLYRDSRCFINAPSLEFYDRHNQYQKIMRRIMARHENVNQHIKAYAVMRERFHRSVNLYARIFKAFINIVK